MKNVLGGTLLVAGTTIGAGMLALPVVTAAGGFLPALAVYFLCWLFMTATGLLLLELCLKFPPDANLVTLSKSYLGKWGAFVAWGLYLFLFYSLSIAYISGGGSLIKDFLPDNVSPSIVFVFFLAPFVFLGAKMVDRINSFLMVGLIGSYLAFVFIGLGHIEFSFLSEINWSDSVKALPVIFTSFAFQGIVPSLTNYLKRDVRKIRIAIIAGTSVAFITYLIWEFLILGIVPKEGLIEAQKLGSTAVAPLKLHVQSSYISILGHCFAFFAIATSFLGVTLGLFDFLADGLQWSKKGSKKFFLMFITFGPPLLVVLINPNVFITALVFAGGVGCSLLLGLMPTLMAWVSRYHNEGHRGPLILPGGKFVLILLFMFVLLELFLEF